MKNQKNDRKPETEIMRRRRGGKYFSAGPHHRDMMRRCETAIKDLDYCSPHDPEKSAARRHLRRCIQAALLADHSGTGVSTGSAPSGGQQD